MVHEQELDNRVLRVPHAVGRGDHDHPVANGRGARGLELRDSLDLDEAHGARADRLPELRLVTEVRDLDVALLGGVHQHRALGRAHLLAVDLEGDPALLGAGHYTCPASGTDASSGAPSGSSSWRSRRARAVSMCISNSGRKCFSIDDTGIAIESPSTHRQLPMMLPWTWSRMSRSIGVPSPSSIRSSIFTVQFVPSRHGTHFPHDSCR